MNPVKLLTLLTTLALLALAGCAPSAMVVFSLQNTDCASCGDTARQAVAMRQGVTEARFDKAKAEIHIAYNPEQTDESALLKAVQGCWSEVKVGEGLGTYQSMDKYEADMDMKVISEAGEDVDITKHLAPGKVTVVDFMAERGFRRAERERKASVTVQAAIRGLRARREVALAARQQIEANRLQAVRRGKVQERNWQRWMYRLCSQ